MIQQGIDIVQKAISEDQANNYESALALYRDALARFTMGLKYEKNEARKKLILERVEGYMTRAEELSDYIKKQNELDKNGGPGGAATKSAGDKSDDVDEEKKKLRGALSGAIVSEKPNIKWDDVAGLANAKESLKEVRKLVINVRLQMKDVGLDQVSHTLCVVFSKPLDGHFTHQIPATLYWQTQTLQRNIVVWSSGYGKILLGQGSGYGSRFDLF